MVKIGLSNGSPLVNLSRLSDTHIREPWLNIPSITCPLVLTMILSLCLSAMPRMYVATQYPAQDSVNSSTASERLKRDGKSAVGASYVNARTSEVGAPVHVPSFVGVVILQPCQQRSLFESCSCRKHAFLLLNVGDRLGVKNDFYQSNLVVGCDATIRIHPAIFHKPEVPHLFVPYWRPTRLHGDGSICLLNDNSLKIHRHHLLKRE